MGWHFDRCDQVKGRLYVVVLTLKNDLDQFVLEDYLKENQQVKKNLSMSDLQAMGDRCANLSFYDCKDQFKKKSLYMAGNTLEIHQPRTIFHRANPIDLNMVLKPDQDIKDPLERIVFVMKFTTDPSDNTSLQKIGHHISYGARTVAAMAKVNYTSVLIAAIVLIVAGVVTAGVSIGISRKRKHCKKQ